MDVLVMKTCKGKNACGRTLPEELFYLNRGYRMYLCSECHNSEQAAYRFNKRPKRIDHAQIARDFCQNLINEKVKENEKQGYIKKLVEKDK